jgi:methyl-accepting chemotaxis protein
VQYSTGFCDWADTHIRPIIDRAAIDDPRTFGSVISDMTGYLPTHCSERSQPQSADPAWNNQYCRNRRSFLDDATRKAIASDNDAMLVTYRVNLSEGKYVPVKNVFVPLRINGRRWGNFELAYRDDPQR